MDLVQALVLGIVQGATEYLPVSSSAHLVLVPAVLGWKFDADTQFIFDILVQLGTLLGVFAYFWRDLWMVASDMIKAALQKAPLSLPGARLGWMVGVATVPATIIGLAFKDDIKGLFHSPSVSVGFLWLTAILLASAELAARKPRTGPEAQNIGAGRAGLIGFAQALALFPGVSRSGSTITMAMWTGMSRPEAARFSFLMSVPVMLGAAILAVDDLLAKPGLLGEMLMPLLVGFAAAAVTGYLVIRWFLAFLGKQRLWVFAGYCAVIATLGFFFLPG